MNPDVMLQIRDAVVYLVALVLSICVHEFGHAYVADKLGDPVPRAQGRVTLNPLAHIDPIGTLLLPLAAFFTAIHNPEVGARILGWGKPVQVSLSARSITRKISIATADILISIAGPVMNLLFGLLLSGIYVALVKLQSPLHKPIAFIVAMNIGLAFFNLLPIPPLDGGNILARMLQHRAAGLAEGLKRFGPYLLLGLLLSGGLGHIMVPARLAARFWLTTLTGWIT
jgi:Zn-dependent protease